MIGLKSFVFLGLAGLLSVPIACTQSSVEPTSSDPFEASFRRFPPPPPPTRTPTPAKTSSPTATPTKTVTGTPTALPPTSTPTPLSSVTPQPTATVAATCNPETALGNEFAGSATMTVDGVVLYAQPETALVSGNLTNISVNIKSQPIFGPVAGIVGVYSNNGGQPGTLLASSAKFTSVTTGPNRFSVPGLAVTQGTSYWLVFYIDTLNSGGLGIGSAGAPGPLLKEAVNLDTLPASYPGGSTETNAVLDIEGDICQ
jgi:hypothetical protein